MTRSGFEQTCKIHMKPKATSRSAPLFPDLEPLNDLLRTPPLSTQDRLLHIQALGRRIDRYIRLMRSVGSMAGSSAEAKELAVAVFHECLAALEPPLGRIPEELQRLSAKRGGKLDP
jgi:hypothetical protein